MRSPARRKKGIETKTKLSKPEKKRCIKIHKGTSATYFKKIAEMNEMANPRGMPKKASTNNAPIKNKNMFI